MSYYRYSFTASLTTHYVGTYAYKAVFLPEAIAAQLPFAQHSRLRFIGEIAAYPIRAAWQPSGVGTYYAMVNAKLIKDAEITLGDLVEVSFNLAPQDAVDIPQPLVHALNTDPSLRVKWDKLSPGKRRGLAYSVASAKTPRTVEKRLVAVIEAVRLGVAPIPKRASKGLEE